MADGSSEAIVDRLVPPASVPGFGSRDARQANALQRQPLTRTFAVADAGGSDERGIIALEARRAHWAKCGAHTTFIL